MAYLAKLTRKTRTYYYLVENIKTAGGKQRQFREYIGTEQPSKAELVSRRARFEKIVEAKRTKLFGIQYLTPDEIKELNQINLAFWARYNRKNRAVQEQFDLNQSVSFVYNINATERASITQAEVETLLIRGIASRKPIEEILETLGNQKALKFAKEYNGKPNEEFVLKLHALCFQESKPQTAGQYKTKPNRFTEAALEPVPPHLTQAAVQDFLEEYPFQKTRLHPLELAAWCHWKLVYISPFQEGNTRIGQILTNLVLLKNKFGLFIFRASEKKAYFKTLEKCNQNGNARPLAVFMFRRYKKQYQDALKE